MANCIRCGRPAKEGEKLCAACSRQEQKPRLPKSILVTLIVLSLVTIGALAVIVAQLLNAHSQRVSLRLREEALDAREKEYAAVQAELEETEDALSEAKQTLLTREEEISSLQSSLSKAESESSQSQYDLNAQKSELERLQQENDALTEQLSQMEEDAKTAGEEKDALTEKLDSLQKENEKLKENQNSLEEKSKFLDAYVVFVENDKSSVYHRYACSAFAKKSFWAYSRKLAESLGYKPCPNCFG